MIKKSPARPSLPPNVGTDLTQFIPLLKQLASSASAMGYRAYAGEILALASIFSDYPVALPKAWTLDAGWRAVPRQVLVGADRVSEILDWLATGFTLGDPAEDWHPATMRCTGAGLAYDLVVGREDRPTNMLPLAEVAPHTAGPCQPAPQSQGRDLVPWLTFLDAGVSHYKLGGDEAKARQLHELLTLCTLFPVAGSAVMAAPALWWAIPEVLDLPPQAIALMAGVATGTDGTRTGLKLDFSESLAHPDSDYILPFSVR